MVGPQTQRKTSLAQVLSVTLVTAAMWLGAILMPTPGPRETLTVAVGMWPGAEPLILAREAGDLPPSRINVVEVNWTSAAMRAVGNRVVDAAVLSLDEALRQIGQGYGLRIVLVTDISHGADAVLARKSIRSMEELAGRRVAYEPRTSAALMLERRLRGAQLGMHQIQEVPINPAETEEVFNELTLDAVALSEPWIERLGGLGLRRLFDSSEPWAAIIRVLVVDGEEIEQRPAEVALLVRAHLKWMAKMPTLGAELEPVLRRSGLDREAFLRILAKLELPSREENLQWLREGGRLVEAMLGIAAELNLPPECGTPEGLAAVIDDRFVREAP